LELEKCSQYHRSPKSKDALVGLGSVTFFDYEGFL
jgi:hypothetical protein